MMNFRKLNSYLTRTLLAVPGFPCPVCGSDAVDGVNSFCADCVEKLPLVPPPRCPGCGGHLDGALERCGKCLALPPRPWTRATAVLEMRDLGRIAVLRFKNGAPELARPLAELCRPWLAADDFRPDFLTPIPLARWRRITRGYNQAELFARALGAPLGLPCVRTLKRRGGAGHQASRGRAGRLRMMRGVFVLRRGAAEAVAGKRIWLVDDVLTTGATLAAATGTLMRAGAAEVRVFVIARR